MMAWGQAAKGAKQNPASFPTDRAIIVVYIVCNLEGPMRASSGCAKGVDGKPGNRTGWLGSFACLSLLPTRPRGLSFLVFGKLEGSGPPGYFLIEPSTWSYWEDLCRPQPRLDAGD